MQQFLYRTDEVDDDMDPLDFGLVKAPSIERAVELVQARLHNIGIIGEQKVYFYRLQEHLGEGIPDSLSRSTHTLDCGNEDLAQDDDDFDDEE